MHDGNVETIVPFLPISSLRGIEGWCRSIYSLNSIAITQQIKGQWISPVLSVCRMFVFSSVNSLVLPELYGGNHFECTRMRLLLLFRLESLYYNSMLDLQATPHNRKANSNLLYPSFNSLFTIYSFRQKQQSRHIPRDGNGPSNYIRGQVSCFVL